MKLFNFDNYSDPEKNCFKVLHTGINRMPYAYGRTYIHICLSTKIMNNRKLFCKYVINVY